MHRPNIKAVKHGQVIAVFVYIPIRHSEPKLVMAEIAEKNREVKKVSEQKEKNHYLLCIFMGSRACHVWHICSNWLNLSHKLISTFPIFLIWELYRVFHIEKFNLDYDFCTYFSYIIHVICKISNMNYHIIHSRLSLQLQFW